MIPEILITMVGAVYLSRVLDFRSESITRTLPQQQRSDFEVLFSGLMKAAIAAAVIFDVLKIAPQRRTRKPAPSRSWASHQSTGLPWR